MTDVTSSRFVVHHADNMAILPTLADCSVDAIVTDPPAGISFMGKAWDSDKGGRDAWIAWLTSVMTECLRVLKPGGHALVWAIPRTSHWTGMAIENAGFEVRDRIAHCFGCLDEETHVATAKGVMPHHKAKTGDLVLCYDKENSEYSYQPILDIVEYDYSDTAYRLVGYFGEQVVSRNHRCLVERGRGEEFRLAETLQREARVPILESLQALQQAFHDAQQDTGRAEQSVQSDLLGGAQVIRAWGGHQTAVVRVVPFHYTGKVWCLRVPTGAFVAVRNGVAFPTGNSGFPKSLDVSKAIDKAGGVSPADQAAVLREARQRAGLSREEVAAAVNCTPSSVRDWEDGRARAVGAPVEFITPTAEYRAALADLLGYTADERDVVGSGGGTRGLYETGHRGIAYGGPKTDSARQWQGWGTALKPAIEDWWLARKPLSGNVAANVLAHGTGALNIDKCRIDGEAWKAHRATGLGSVKFFSEGDAPVIDKAPHALGRWPANLILSGEPEVLAAFPDVHGAGFARTGSENPVVKEYPETVYGKQIRDTGCVHRFGDTGSAARFFMQCPPDEATSLCYTPKASRADRDKGNTHSTVKPISLMRYLCRLITPPDGVVLDPFSGSGSTGQAAMFEGFRFIGIEQDAGHVELARHRIGLAARNGWQVGLELEAAA